MFDGKDGEKRLEEITKELQKYYKENKDATKKESPRLTKSPIQRSMDSLNDLGGQSVDNSTDVIQLPVPQVSDPFVGREINHVQRNALLMSKFKQITDIKHQINQDIMYTRLFNS